MTEGRRARKIGPVSATLLGLAAIGAVLLFATTRPARSDMCSSEVLTNGRGVSVNLAAKTLKLGAQQQAVPLEKISDQSALIIDSLSRLCRERKGGNITEAEYQQRFEEIVVRLRGRAKSRASEMPMFSGEVDMVGGGPGVRKLVAFLEGNEGSVVRIDARLDFSRMHGAYPIFQACLADRPEPEDYPVEDNFSGEELILPYRTRDLSGSAAHDADVPEQERHEFCNRYAMIMNLLSEPVPSYGGTGVVTYDIDGYFRVRAQERSGNTTAFYLSELQASPADYIRP